MAIRYIDSYSHYDTPNIFTKWTTPQNQVARFPGASIVPGTGRCLQSAMQVQRFSDTTVGTGPCLLVDNNLTEGAMGTGVQYPAAGIDSLTGSTIFIIKNQGVFVQNTQLEIGINSDGTVRAFTIDPVLLTITELGRTTATLQAGSWHFVEVVFKIHATLGIVQIFFDGNATPKLNLSNVNTAPQGVNVWSVFQVGQIYTGSGGTPGSGTILFSDTYIGDAQTDRKGDSRAFVRLPTGDGTYKQWTPLLVGPHYQMVDDNPPDDDLTYNSTATPGLIDTYTFPPIAVPSGTVYAVQLLPRLKKDNVGTRSAATFIRQGGADFVGTTQPLAAGQYLYYRQIYVTDPLGGAWTVTTANADEFGVKLIE